MAENPRNIQFLCLEHSPKPIGFDGDPQALIGKFVKKCFFEGGEPKEHMWVKVKEVTADGVLRGELNNEPVVVNDVKCGDTVTVHPEDIEEVLG